MENKAIICIGQEVIKAELAHAESESNKRTIVSVSTQCIESDKESYYYITAENAIELGNKLMEYGYKALAENNLSSNAE